MAYDLTFGVERFSYFLLHFTENLYFILYGGEGGIRTLARFYPANPLAGGPLEPLGYLSKSNIRK